MNSEGVEVKKTDGNQGEHHNREKKARKEINESIENNSLKF